MSRLSPNWAHGIKVPYVEYNYENHGVIGDFESALRFLIESVKTKEGCYSHTLAKFDNIRGNDWYVSTRRELYGTHEIEEV